MSMDIHALSMGDPSVCLGRSFVLFFLFFVLGGRGGWGVNKLVFLRIDGQVVGNLWELLIKDYCKQDDCFFVHFVDPVTMPDHCGSIWYHCWVNSHGQKHNPQRNTHFQPSRIFVCVCV